MSSSCWEILKVFRLTKSEIAGIVECEVTVGNYAQVIQGGFLNEKRTASVSVSYYFYCAYDFCRVSCANRINQMGQLVCVLAGLGYQTSFLKVNSAIRVGDWCTCRHDAWEVT